MTMPREVAHRRPATIRPALERTAVIYPKAPAPVRRAETLIGDRNAISKELARLQSAGELATTGTPRLIQAGPHAGLIRCDVTLRDAPAPNWTRRAIAIGAGLGVFTAVAGSILWVLASMSGAALLGLCASAVLGLWAAVRAGRGSSRTSGVTAIAVASVTVNR